MNNGRRYSRVNNIDILRGAVMVIMALDHTRDFFHKYSYYHEPTDLAHTSPVIFFTRWITHFCAPVFVFLAGTSAFISGQKKTKKELSLFLLKRGIWLMVLELTLVNFGWFFNPLFSLQGLQVIWVLGLSMLVLAALIHLPLKVIGGFGILLIIGHNLLDNIHVPGNSMSAFAWSELHEFNVFQCRNLIVITAYPLVPWVGVMALGYFFGSLYKESVKREKRNNILLITGIGCILLFIVIRSINIYGDPQKWVLQSNNLYSVLSFLNASKYPPSLLYLLMTLGPALVLLSIDRMDNKFTRILMTYGRVPLFYYLIHIYVLHLLAMLAAELTGFKWSDMIFYANWITQQPALKGYGFSLLVVYLIWALTVIILYPFCSRYDAYKVNNSGKWWLKYL